jgi:hypothetical protein
MRLNRLLSVLCVILLGAVGYGSCTNYGDIIIEQGFDPNAVILEPEDGFTADDYKIQFHSVLDHSDGIIVYSDPETKANETELNWNHTSELYDGYVTIWDLPKDKSFRKYPTADEKDMYFEYYYVIYSNRENMRQKSPLQKLKVPLSLYKSFLPTIEPILPSGTEFPTSSDEDQRMIYFTTTTVLEDPNGSTGGDLLQNIEVRVSADSTFTSFVVADHAYNDETQSEEYYNLNLSEFPDVDPDANGKRFYYWQIYWVLFDDISIPVGNPVEFSFQSDFVILDTGSSSTITGIDLVDPQNGWLVGPGATLIQYKNGVFTEIDTSSLGYIHFYSVQAETNDSCWIGAEQGHVIYRANDGSYTTITDGSTNNDVTDLFMFDNLSGGNGVVQVDYTFYSIHNGTWETINGIQARALFGLTSAEIYLYGDGQLFTYNHSTQIKTQVDIPGYDSASYHIKAAFCSNAGCFLALYHMDDYDTPYVLFYDYNTVSDLPIITRTDGYAIGLHDPKSITGFTSMENVFLIAYDELYILDSTTSWDYVYTDMLSYSTSYFASDFGGTTPVYWIGMSEGKILKYLFM